MSLPLTTVVLAATPPVMLQARQAIAAAHSFKITISIASATATTSMVETVVRQGKTVEMYVISKMTEADGRVTIVDEVLGAKHTCIRLTGQGAWNCTMPPMTSLLADALSFTPTTATGSLSTAQITWAPAGNKVVQGQLCTGFNATTTTSTRKSSDIIWFSIASKYPVQVNSTGVPLGKSTSGKDSVTIVWSNWNDPSLSIPSVGA